MSPSGTPTQTIEYTTTQTVTGFLQQSFSAGRACNNIRSFSMVAVRQNSPTVLIHFGLQIGSRGSM